jgi:unsaturated rhamnogalacturonyl hydrolase
MATEQGILRRAHRKTACPAKTSTTMAARPALSYLYEYHRRRDLTARCAKSGRPVGHGQPSQNKGSDGFQHITVRYAQRRDLWDDTLFMTVLVLANMGRILGRQDYTDEAVYQFLLHTKYLADKKTGLWYHGFTFHGNHNFAGAFWGRGNCWVTIAIPLLLEMLPVGQPARRILVNALENQIASLAKYQDGNGMWHTLIDDPTSYVEASATSGFGYGILKAVHMGLVDAAYAENAKKALAPILKCIREDGIVDQVSYGTAMGRETKDFYKQIPLRQMPYGQAMAMLFLMEAGEEA